MAGLFAIAGGIFTAITVGLFEALAVTLPEVVMRLIVFGGVGLIPVLAVAVIYDPGVTPAEQSFDEGLSKVIATLMRVLLPLTLIVLVVYLAFIPFRFWEPFQNRDVLIIYNAMLFAVIALLVGATPIKPADAGAGAARLAAPRADRRGPAGDAGEPLRAGRHRLSHVGGRHHPQPADHHRLERHQHRRSWWGCWRAR